MKCIAVQVSGKLRRDQLLDDLSYADGYRDLGAALATRGAQLFLTKDAAENYRSNGNFARGWRFESDDFVFHDAPFAVDTIFVKDSAFTARGDIEVINDPALDRLCNDKAQTFALFPDLSPASVILRSQDELQAALDALPSDLIVCKPLHGYGGEGVMIGSRMEIVAGIRDFPILVQEFIDTSAGIPGLTTTLHDYRMIIVNGEVIFTFIRTPRKGSLLSNVALGGMMMPVPRAMRPQETLALIPIIDAALARFGKRMYSIDLGRRRDGRWFLIELNAPPAQQSRLECGDEADVYFRKMCELLLDAEPSGAR